MVCPVCEKEKDTVRVRKAVSVGNPDTALVQERFKVVEMCDECYQKILNPPKQ